MGSLLILMSVRHPLRATLKVGSRCRISCYLWGKKGKLAVFKSDDGDNLLEWDINGWVPAFHVNISKLQGVPGNERD